ncbi:MAG: transglutaminase family protein [Clostridia bacterium]|nr:transglutaminase family protein [Clostridia bacterium]
MKKAISIFVSVVLFLTAFPFSVSAADDMAISITPDITDAVYSYLNEVYVEKYPALALDFSFGSCSDRRVLQKLADMLTKDCKTDEEKAIAVVSWADRNINYKSYVDTTYYFPIDVFAHRTGNCLGLGLFISQVLRLAGVPGVFCAGTRGDMKDHIRLSDREIDHGWVMIYYNNTWNLFDPLFDVFGTDDREFISRWYFTDHIEGVSPHYEGMPYEYVFYGDCIFYIDGRFIHYKDGMPASEYWGNAAEGGSALNGSVPYFTKNRYDSGNGGGDGFYHIDDPDRKKSMINDECYSGGWINYGDMVGYYTKENGIIAGCTVKEYNGEKLFLPYGSTPLRLHGDADEYTLTWGAPTFILGEEIIAPEPLWVESEIANGRVITYESITPEIATVSETGKITALQEGYVSVMVSSRDSYDDPGNYCGGFIEIYVAAEKREYDYSDKLIVEATEIKVMDDTNFAARENTTVEAVKNSLLGAVITDEKGNVPEEDAVIGSGWTVTLPGGMSVVAVIPGDLDSDGGVSSADARLTLRASVGLENNPNEWFTKAGDIEKDEGGAKLSAADARTILRGSVGLENRNLWYDAIGQTVNTGH